MAKRDRQERYKTSGAAADLVKVETLVPPQGRAQILALAAKLRDEHRRAKTPLIDVASIVAQVRAACRTQPRRYTQPSDIDTLVITSVNVPFPHPISAESLADAIRRDTVPAVWAGHLGRFLGEVPLVSILRFCDRHGIKAPALARFVRGHSAELALRRPELEEHLNVLVPAA
ncbi:hypothetical protein GALL_159130 [mine drainage metagenome]|uniref:Uncharacterized protein n=1 Tax=mine drainage metagenome TaxID=410659 RepID=A0A1J5S1G3_9ZZZZ